MKLLKARNLKGEMTKELYIGLISGTSMDAIDLALVQIENDKPEILLLQSNPIPTALKYQLLGLTSNTGIDLRSLGNADISVGKLFADCINHFLQANKIPPGSISAIGSHGQTIWHEPPQFARQNAFTVQIGDPNTIAEMTGITTVADFRRRDMAAGGQGAPIVPALHWELFQNPLVDRIVLNLGGIANITFLPKSGTGSLGLDTGPANVLMDTWIDLHLHQPFDEEGCWAQSALSNQELLDHFLDEPYFQLPSPKSTGRELFNLAWIEAKLSLLVERPSTAEVQATLLQLTVESISREIDKLTGKGEIIVCGGGARNKALMQSLGKRLPAFRISVSTEHGLDADYVEAVAFAWFASRTLKRQLMEFQRFTGARNPVIAGGIYYA